MQPIGTVALPSAPIRIALPVGIDCNQEAVQAMRPGGDEEAAKARPAATRQWKRVTPPVWTAWNEARMAAVGASPLLVRIARL